MIPDILRTAFRSILRNRMRTLLTTLGIVIGVAAVIIMVSVGKGAQKDIQARISSLGTNMLMVRGGSANSGGVRLGADSHATLTIDDITALQEGMTQISAVSGVARTSAQLSAQGSNWPSSIEGVNPSYLKIRNWTLSSGTFFTDRDVKIAKKVAIIGVTVATNLFGNRDPLGQQIRIGKVPFQIVGVLKEIGASGMGDQDDIVLAPLNTVLYRLEGSGRLQQIVASAVSMEQTEEATDEITLALRKSHRLRDKEEDDFSIRTQSEILETATSMTQTLTLLLSAIAAVSLLVGGIGIMNIMLVSVTERTREIGIRMALGARGSDILMQFLIESIVLCTLGGILGVLLALASCEAITHFSGISTIFDWVTLFISVAFSAIVGIFFGFYPAQKASRLNPIDALRYE